MNSGKWMQLLRRIPEDRQDRLIVVMATGTEIVVQKIVHQEDDFLVIKGRLAGNTDDGRAVLIPFDQIVSLSINQVLPEAEIIKSFGLDEKTNTHSPPPPTQEPETPAFAKSPEPLAPELVSGPPTGSAQGVKKGSLSQILQLDRLRARLKSHGETKG